jgi:hypothetical protein
LSDRRFTGDEVRLPNPPLHLDAVRVILKRLSPVVRFLRDGFMRSRFATAGLEEARVGA